MKIIVKLRIHAFIYICLTLLTAAILIFAAHRVEFAERNERIAGDIVRHVFERAGVRADYLLYHEGRAKMQWLNKQESIAKLIQSVTPRFDEPEEKTLFDKLSQVNDNVGVLFNDIVKNHERPKVDSKDIALSKELEARLVSRLLLKAQDGVESAVMLQVLSANRSESAREQSLAMIIGLVALLSFTVFLNTINLTRTLSQRIDVLNKGVNIIGAGNLDHLIDIQGEDELAELARVSNEMASKLKESFTSVGNLEKEIERRKQVEQSLRESEERFRIVAETANDVVYEWDLKHSVQWLGKIDEMLGYEPGEFPRTLDGWVNSLHPEDLEPVMAAIQANLEGRAPYAAEYRVRRKDGSYSWWTARGAVTRTPDGNPVRWIGSITDITERKQAEERQMNLLTDLERSNKELEQFAYVASHDLQEPLRMVSSYTQLLAQRYEGQLDDKAQKYIDYAVDGAVRMQGLINDLLAYSRVNTQGGTLEAVDSHSALGEALRNLSTAIEENGALVVNDDLPTVQADASQLMQLFQNLIGNAIKFRGADAPRIQISADDLGDEWRFSVKDNGIGIDAQYADKVFVIFQRLHTKREYQGTGIGLAICKRIVERHRGRIWFESEPGKGCMFYFTLPKS